LLVQEKETKEKDTPTAPPSGHPALRVRERRPGFADDASCIAANARASCARPCGPDRPPSTGAEGGPRSKERRAPARRSRSRSRAEQAKRSKTKQKQTQVRASRLKPLPQSRESPCGSGFSRDASARRMRAALPPGSPCGPASGWRTSPKGRAHDARAFVAVHGWTVNEPRNPIAQSAGRSPLTGPLGVSFLLVPFLWTSTAPQERREQRSWPEGRRAGCPESRKGTGPQGCGTNLQGRG